MPLVPDPSLKLSQGVRDWVERYNHMAPEENPSGPAIIRKAIRKARDWAAANNRPVHLGEFGCYIKADPASRLRFHAEFRRTLDAAGMPWALWDWKAGFRYWDAKRNQPVDGMRETLFPAASSR